ncbi:MAG TPA: radical SAM family heme chaperone HemW [Tepidisphaeraceae bacterium]|jgi:oxygen-independent coproporphyrinogen-3 oxidase|nr:radical SAM family heme chaperone HemW [Tepidisphaeraceae bacterium]
MGQSLVSLGLPNAQLHPRQLPRAVIPGLYVHIPFCFHKCHYCDFYSITRQTPERITRFVNLLLAEADMWAEMTVRPKTVFFGGGTPSLLPIDQMHRLIQGLRERFDFSELNEWTVEVNPATASLEYCQMLRETGVDRLSFGAQSFNRDELKTLERHHDPDDVPRSIDLARAAGFSRLNVDLIYAIPNQSIESWERSLAAAIDLKIPHISAYNLTYEPNTPIAVKKRLGLLEPTAEPLEIDMMKLTRERLLTSSRPAYEISNYATPNEECRHNLLYWTGGSYVGLGPSAASHVEGTRFKNRPHLGEWEAAIHAGHLPASDVETLSPDRRRGELVMLMLRLTRGVSFDEYTDRMGTNAQTDFADQLSRLSKIQMIETDESGFRLTDKGLVVADAIGAEFLVL